MSEKETLAGALAEAQGEYPEIKKDKVNPHFKSKYASLDSIMRAVREVNQKHGLAVSQILEEDEQGNPVVRTILMHRGGEKIEGRARLIVDRNNMQGLGSAVTYARRYGLAGILGVCPDEDDDGNAATAAPPKNGRQRKPPAKPKDAAKSVEMRLGQCNSPAEVKALLEKWEKAKPVDLDNAKHWYDTVCKAERRCQEWGEGHEAEVTLKLILSAAQTFLQADEKFGGGTDAQASSD